MPRIPFKNCYYSAYRKLQPTKKLQENCGLLETYKEGVTHHPPKTHALTHAQHIDDLDAI